MPWEPAQAGSTLRRWLEFCPFSHLSAHFLCEHATEGQARMGSDGGKTDQPHWPAGPPPAAAPFSAPGPPLHPASAGTPLRPGIS